MIQILIILAMESEIDERWWEMIKGVIEAMGQNKVEKKWGEVVHRLVETFSYPLLVIIQTKVCQGKREMINRTAKCA